MGLDHVAGDGEAEAGTALIGGLLGACLAKRFEQSRLILRCDAGSLVAHGKNNLCGISTGGYPDALTWR